MVKSSVSSVRSPDKLLEPYSGRKEKGRAASQGRSTVCHGASAQHGQVGRYVGSGPSSGKHVSNGRKVWNWGPELGAHFLYHERRDYLVQNLGSFKDLRRGYCQKYARVTNGKLKFKGRTRVLSRFSLSGRTCG